MTSGPLGKLSQNEIVRAPSRSLKTTKNFVTINLSISSNPPERHDHHSHGCRLHLRVSAACRAAVRVRARQSQQGLRAAQCLHAPIRVLAHALVHIGATAETAEARSPPEAGPERQSAEAILAAPARHHEAPRYVAAPL